MRLKVDCAGKWFLISSYLLLSLQTDDRRPFSSGKWPNLGRKQVYKLGKVVICAQYRPVMRSFQEGEEECLWVERMSRHRNQSNKRGPTAYLPGGKNNICQNICNMIPKVIFDDITKTLR